MAWQPTPPPTGEPAPATVDRLCGQPLQNPAVRVAAGLGGSRVELGARPRRLGGRDQRGGAQPLGQAAGQDRAQPVRGQLAVDRDQRPVLLVPLAGDPRPLRRSYSCSRANRSMNGRFSSTTRSLLHPAGGGAEHPGLHRVDHAQPDQPDPGAADVVVGDQAEVGQGLAHLPVARGRPTGSSATRPAGPPRPRRGGSPRRRPGPRRAAARTARPPARSCRAGRTGAAARDRQGRPPKDSSGRRASIRPAATSAEPNPSATAVTIFRPTQQPLNRDSS